MPWWVSAWECVRVCVSLCVFYCSDIIGMCVCVCVCLQLELTVSTHSTIYVYVSVTVCCLPCHLATSFSPQTASFSVLRNQPKCLCSGLIITNRQFLTRRYKEQRTPVTLHIILNISQQKLQLLYVCVYLQLELTVSSALCVCVYVYCVV